MKLMRDSYKIHSLTGKYIQASARKSKITQKVGKNAFVQFSFI